jgi:hypothetical protein
MGDIPLEFVGKDFEDDDFVANARQKIFSRLSLFTGHLTGKPSTTPNIELAPPRIWPDTAIYKDLPPLPDSSSNSVSTNTVLTNSTTSTSNAISTNNPSPGSDSNNPSMILSE